MNTDSHRIGPLVGDGIGPEIVAGLDAAGAGASR